MKVLCIADGVRVKCKECKKYHTVKGYKGDKLRWEDSIGWSGSWDTAHGCFDSTKANTLCPDCTKLVKEKIDLVREVNNSLRGWAKEEEKFWNGQKISFNR